MIHPKPALVFLSGSFLPHAFNSWLLRTHPPKPTVRGRDMPKKCRAAQWMTRDNANDPGYEHVELVLA